MGLSSTVLNYTLKTSSTGDSTMSLGSLFQCLIVLPVKKCLSCIKMKIFFVSHVKSVLYKQVCINFVITSLPVVVLEANPGFQ